MYSIENPDIIQPHTEKIVELLPAFSHFALRRHSLHILTRVHLPDANLGSLMSICFDWLLTPGIPAAVKVYSMEVLYRIACQMPELKKELADCIGFRLHEETPGFKNRGFKILKKLSKLETTE